MSDIKKRFSLNLLMNFLSFLLKVIIGLWMIPYLVKYIGLIAYGLVPLSLFFAEYVSIIIESFNSAMNRYLIVSLQKKDFESANEYFNTSLILGGGFILFQGVIMSTVIINLTSVINVPLELVNDAYWLFSLTFLGFSLSLFRGIFTTQLFSYNRLDLIKGIEIINIVSNAFIMVVLFSVIEPSLKIVGVAYLIASIIAFVLTVYFSKKIAPQITIDLKRFNKKQLTVLSKMGGWVLVTQVGSLLFIKLDLFIANKFIGAYESGALSLVMQWNSVIRALAAIVSGVMTPIIMMYYANGEFDKLERMLKVEIKALAILIAVPVGILSGLADSVITLWIGSQYLFIKNFLIISIGFLIVNVATTPLLAVAIAYNKVKYPGIISLILGLLSSLTTIFGVIYTGYGLYVMVLISGVFLTIKNGFFIPVYIAKIMNIRQTSFIFSPLIGILFGLITYFIIRFLNNFILVDSLMSLLYVSVIALFILMGVLYVYIKKDTDMRYLFNIFAAKFTKRIKYE